MGLVVEGTPLRGGAENDVAAGLAYTVDEYLQIVHIVIPGAVARTVLFLVVVAELAHHVVALPKHGENLVQPVGAQEGAGGETTLGVVGYGHLVVKPARNHLPPRSPGVVFLVYHGGVSAEEDGGGCGVACYLDATHGRRFAIELEREQVVPVQVVLFALLDFHHALLQLYRLVVARRLFVEILG